MMTVREAGNVNAFSVQQLLHNFFPIAIITAFSIAVGAVLAAVLGQYGPVIALPFYCTAFLADYKSTVMHRQYRKFETNPIFCALSGRVGARASFATILAVGITANAIPYVILGDPFFSYMLGMCHVCAAACNLHAGKGASYGTGGKIQ